MDLFNKITVSNFIWYLVPGLGLIFFIFFPLTGINPQVTKNIFTTFGSFGIIVLAIIFGFILDGLRLYRWRPNYKKIREQFFCELQQIIGQNLNPYFIQSHISDIAIKKNVTGLNLHHAIWIMLGHFTILSFMESLIWFLMTLYFAFYDSANYQLFDKSLSKCTIILICEAFVLFFIFISFRFLHISLEDQENTNQMFLNFGRQHRKELLEFLNIKDVT